MRQGEVSVALGCVGRRSSAARGLQAPPANTWHKSRTGGRWSVRAALEGRPTHQATL
jgi:hypothetical protein